MKITLRELRTLVRESVRQHLNESNSESPPGPEMSNDDLVKAAIAAQIAKDEVLYNKLKSKIEEKINKLKMELSALPPGDEGLAGRGILPARIGNLQRGLMSPADRNNYDNKMGGIKMAKELGFGPESPIGPDGRYVPPAELEEVTMSLQELRSLVREAVRKQINK